MLNRFSIILNNNDESKILTIYAYGKIPIDITYKKALVNDKEVSLPHDIAAKNIYISRTINGVCVDVKNNDIQICCNEDSNSCQVVLSGWWNGKVNGALGETNNSPNEVKQENWSINAAAENVEPKKSTDEAVKKCKKLFAPFYGSLLKFDLIVRNILFKNLLWFNF